MAKKSYSNNYHDSHVKLYKHYKAKAEKAKREAQYAERERKRLLAEKKRDIERRIHDKEKARARRERAVHKVQQGFSSTASAFTGGGLRILLIIFAFITLYNLFGYFTGSPRVFTFSAFLEFLPGAPTIPTDWLSSFTLELGDWGVFQFLADFIEIFVSFIEIIIFYSTGMINALLFIVYFVGWVILG